MTRNKAPKNSAQRAPVDKPTQLHAVTYAPRVAQIGCESCDTCCNPNATNFQHRFLHRGAQTQTASESVNQILFLLSGTILVASVSTQDYSLAEGNMTLLLSGYAHTITATDDAEFIIVRTGGTIQVCQTISATRVREILHHTEPTTPILPIYPPMSRLLESLKEYIHDNVNCIYLNRAKGMEIFVILRFYYSLEQLVHFFQSILAGRVYFHSQVLANYRTAKNVPELAQVCGYGLSNFKHLFKRYFGQPPYQWMRETQAHDISEALRNKEIPLKMVASMFNFSDQSHLNAYCKKYFGATPGQIRER